MLTEKEKNKIDRVIKEIIVEIREGLPKEDKELEKSFKETEQITIKVIRNRKNNLLADLELYLQEEALKKEIFSISENQTIFYEKNIFEKLKEEIAFDINQKINYKKGEELEKQLKEAGIIFAASGIISFIIPSAIPVSIGLIIAGTLYYTAKKNPKIREKKFKKVVNEYLDNLEISLHEWVKSVVTYYDKEVEKLENELKNKELKDGKE